MKRSVLLASFGLVSLLAGCGGVAETLGMGRHPPDEFAVVERPPLALPPDYTLRPPAPGAARPQESAPAAYASAALYGAHAKIGTTPDLSSSAGASRAESGTEKALLESAGAGQADPAIRSVVDREASEKVVGNKHLIDDLLWWKKDEVPATTVDATAEAERLKEAKETGEPVNKTATPVIERQKSGWLGL